MAVIQIIPTVSSSICHFKMKISGKKKGKLKVIMIFCTFIQPFCQHLLVTSMCPALGTWEKMPVLSELTFLMGKIASNNDCTISPEPLGQNL